MEKNKEVEKKQYDVKIETQVPATISWRVLAESPEQALEMIRNTRPKDIKYSLNLRRDIKAAVYDAGTILIRFTKSLLR